MDSPVVVLLAGSPHGGANITNLILGQHPSFFATGELKNFPDGRQIMDERTCSCGEKSTDCSFWVSVRDAYAAHEGEPDEIRIPALYEIISRLSQRRFIGDVAQDYERAEQLCGIPQLDLRLIQVVRDGRAVVNAGIRPARRGGIKTTGWQRVVRTAKITKRWRRQADRLSMLVSKMGPRGLSISYDALCADPRKVIGDIGHFLDLDLTGTADRIMAGEPLDRVPHLLRGGQKFIQQKTVVLKHDDRFRREMTGLESCIFHFVSTVNHRFPVRTVSS